MSSAQKFKCSCHQSKAKEDDGLTRILIFGITGMTGGAVAEGAIGSSWYHVSGFTRKDSGEIFEEIRGKGVKLFVGDMLNYETVEAAMAAIDVVFLNTFYWDMMDPLIEFKQGTNVVDAAMKCGVKHLIYAGTDYSVLTAQVRCPYLEGKAMVSDYIINVGIPYTIVRMGFYFENFISVFRPHPLTRLKYAITLPMHTVPINCGSIQDFGRCIATVGLRPGTYAYTLIHLSTEYLNVDSICRAFNHNFTLGAKFADGKASMKTYKTFNFRGSQELTSMFAHYRTQLQWGDTLVKKLVTSPQTLDMWVQRNEKIIQSTLDEVFFDVFGVKPGAKTDDFRDNM